MSAVAARNSTTMAAMTAGEINAILVIPNDFDRRLDDRRRGLNDQPLAQWISLWGLCLMLRAGWGLSWLRYKAGLP